VPCDRTYTYAAKTLLVYVHADGDNRLPSGQSPSLTSLFDSVLGQCLVDLTGPCIHGLRSAASEWNELITQSPIVPLEFDLDHLGVDMTDHMKLCFFLARWAGPVDAYCKKWSHDGTLGPRLLALVEVAKHLRLRSLEIENEEDVAGAVGAKLGSLKHLKCLSLKGQQDIAVLRKYLPKLPTLRDVSLSYKGGIGDEAFSMAAISDVLVKCTGLEKACVHCDREGGGVKVCLASAAKVASMDRI
jgi:hypothetical protein